MGQERSNRNEAVDTQSGKPKVKAKAIADVLKRSKSPRRLLYWPKKALLPSEHKTVIEGDLDLRNLVINRPLEFKSCVFQGNVDLRYCEFNQAVNFTNCTFIKRFNSGDASRSLTIYHKDLIFNKCCFKDEAYFNRIQVEGDADFTGSRFELERVEKRHDSLLESDYTVDFADAQFGYQFICNGAIFKGPVNFKAIKCGASGSFNGAHFITKTKIKSKEEINFKWAAFDRNFLSRGTEYRAGGNFRSVKCGYNAVFERARFDEEVDMRFLDIGRDLDLRWTYWAKRAKLGQIQIAKKLALGGASFQGAVELYDSSIGVLELWDPNHRYGKVIQVRTRKEDHLDVVVHEDHGELDTLDESEEESEYLRNRIRRRIYELGNGLQRLAYCLLSRMGQRKVSFLRAPKNQDEPDDLVKRLFPFKLRDENYVPGLNMTGITFERFHGGPSERLAKRLALKLADKQDPIKFSIDPYLQLRNHYLKIGDENTAGEVRSRGYRALRKNAWSHWCKQGGRTAWSWKRWLAEVLLYWPTSYGHRIWPLLVLTIGGLVITGTIIFWSQGALSPAQRSKNLLKFPLART